MKYRFLTFTELESILNTEHISAQDYAIKREAFITGQSENEIQTELDRRISITRDGIIKGLSEKQISRSGLTQAGAVTYAQASRGMIQDQLLRRSIAYSLAINEVNACGGRVVAFPTAGSSGIVPGAIWAWWDTRRNPAEARSGGISSYEIAVPQKINPPYDEPLRGAFLVSSLAGVLAAQTATLAGSEGGCQAECGVAGAMAAAALTFLEGLSLKECFSAAALSLKNSLGLACDPVAGLVEVPCVKRNAFTAMNAITAADITLAGIQSVIPFDEVVWAMKQIGDALPSIIKENSTGGLAVTPTGLAFKAKLEET